MSPPALDTAIIAAMQADPNATQRMVRKLTGGSEHYFSEAVKRLRYAGKIEWERFGLSPSMKPKISPIAAPLPRAAVKAKDGAGNARREDPRLHAAGSTLPGPSTIAEQVNAEARGRGQRRADARKISATVHDPLPSAEPIDQKFRRLAREIEDEEAEALAEQEARERSERELERLGSPSAVLRRAKRDWPKQCADVQALAAELGVTLGEAWRRTIAAGVDCMRAGGDGEAVA